MVSGIDAEIAHDRGGRDAEVAAIDVADDDAEKDQRKDQPAAAGSYRWPRLKIPGSEFADKPGHRLRCGVQELFAFFRSGQFRHAEHSVGRKLIEFVDQERRAGS